MLRKRVLSDASSHVIVSECRRRGPTERSENKACETETHPVMVTPTVGVGT
jgi:hypothetical protein